MSKGVNITFPESELIKFKLWTKSLSEENQRQCQTLIRGAAFKIVSRAMMFAPVDKGFLKGSIGTNANQGRLSAEVWAGGQGKGINVRYAPYVEFGTGSMVRVASDVSDYASEFKGKGLRKVNLHARPYFFPAVRLTSAEFMIKLKQMGFK